MHLLVVSHVADSWNTSAASPELEVPQGTEAMHAVPSLPVQLPLNATADAPSGLSPYTAGHVGEVSWLVTEPLVPVPVACENVCPACAAGCASSQPPGVLASYTNKSLVAAPSGMLAQVPDAGGHHSPVPQSLLELQLVPADVHTSAAQVSLPVQSPLAVHCTQVLPPPVTTLHLVLPAVEQSLLEVHSLVTGAAHMWLVHTSLPMQSPSALHCTHVLRHVASEHTALPSELTAHSDVAEHCWRHMLAWHSWALAQSVQRVATSGEESLCEVGTARRPALRAAQRCEQPQGNPPPSGTRTRTRTHAHTRARAHTRTHA